MANPQATSLDSDDKDPFYSQITRRKEILYPVVFASIIAVSAVLVDALWSSEGAAILITWGVYMFFIVVVFAVLPYYAIGLLGYRER